jgi:hypothetical protein
VKAVGVETCVCWFVRGEGSKLVHDVVYLLVLLFS